MITTSYFGNRNKPNGTLIAVVRYAFPFVRVMCDEVDSSFAPSVELLRGYRSGHISWQDYIPKYRIEQRLHFRDKPNDFINLLQRATVEDIVLCCYERYEGESTHCHRLLLYGFLKKIAEKRSIDVKFVNEK